MHGDLHKLIHITNYIWLHDVGSYTLSLGVFHDIPVV